MNTKPACTDKPRHFARRRNTRLSIFLVTLMISGSAAAVDVSPRISDREIIERLTRLEEGQRAMREYIDQRFSAVDERFSSIEQRLSAVEQRLSAVEQRLSAMEQRFSAMEQRFSAMEQRFPAMEQRFSAMQAHLDKRMDAQWQLTLVLITAIFGLIGFVVWDRKTAFKSLEERAEQRCRQVRHPTGNNLPTLLCLSSSFCVAMTVT
uniref:Maltoporin N-terminal extension n=1 Tax=Candidatus Kentrum sp. FM TaxID=2126340 RepID=A0A450SHU9_9GAMM|nr:MAG: Maltoporin N-terminal extension [Candidatus Kentron sp. FM]VFJ52822.1 MAG: Maltoporin N-terminal extension [Candidatus Kentron sp. FM]VFK09056.1 MAG: Maltoporin N-terminal extension [Candidatus Kentron sp. FM]